jgi:O-antigen/teichoic acid export membrane protein
MPRRDARFTAYLWLQSLCIIITFQSDRYLVVSYFGLVALSYYGLTATVFNHLHMGLGGLLPWLVPKFTKRHALHMNSLDIYHAANCLITAAALLVLLALSVSYPYLFKWLLHAETESQMHDYTQCFLAFEAFFALSIVPTYYLNAVGQERAYFHYMLLFSLTALAAMWVSIQLLHTPLAVVYGLFIACAVAVSALTILMGKIQTGSYKPLHAFYQLLPSMLTALFIFSTNLYLKAAVGLGALAAIYFMNLRGRRQQFIQLIKI